jgi:peptide/nickel transport system permease protein
MGIYLLKRIGLSIVIIGVAVTLLYAMIHLAPGDPANVILGPKATPEMKAELAERMGLNKPFIVQVLSFLGNVFTGDLGTDVFSNRPVAKIVFEQLPYTIILIVTSMGWAMLIGIPLGCFSAIFRNSFWDRLTGLMSISVIAVPSFVVALYSLLIFAVYLQWFPAIGAGEPGDWRSQIMHLILPSIAVGISWVGYLARLVRASMLEVMNEDHVRTARAYGLPEIKIIIQYALRLAILPTITLVGVSIGRMLSTTVFTEIVFARPGIGRLIYESVISRNYNIVMGSVLVSTVVFVLATIITDIINGLLDPRIGEIH